MTSEPSGMRESQSLELINCGVPLELINWPAADCRWLVRWMYKRGNGQTFHKIGN